MVVIYLEDAAKNGFKPFLNKTVALLMNRRTALRRVNSSG